MKILYILSQHPGNTGSGVYLKWITKEAIKNNHNIKVLIGINKNFDFSKELPHINKENIFTVKFQTDKLPFPIPGMSDVMPYTSTKFREMSPNQIQQYKNAFINKLLKIKNIFLPDIIHSNHLWIVSSLIKKVYLKIPLIVSCHGTELRQKEFCPHIAKNIKKDLNLIDYIIALTSQQKKEILNWLEIDDNKIYVLGAAYSDEIFFCKNKNFSNNIFRITYAGKISKAKGVPYLIEAFKRLKKYNNIKLELNLAGGYDNDEGKNIVNSVKEKNIKFLGNISQQELAKLFINSNIFILPSFFEGLPLVVLEALACGCGIIVTELKNIKKWFDEEFLKLNVVKFIPLPKLKNIDEIDEKDIENFINSIKNRIELFIEDFINQKFPDIEKITDYIKKHSYSNLFLKLTNIYKTACKKKIVMLNR